MALLFYSYAHYVITIIILIIIVVVKISNDAKEIKDKIEFQNKIKQMDFIGKDLKQIENEIGIHTSVNMSNDNQRIYIWGTYLELLCDKNNICIEVLKNTI